MTPTDELRKAQTDAKRWERTAHELEGLCKSLRETNGDLRSTIKGMKIKMADAVAAATVGSDEPPYNELIEALRRDWNIDISWDGLRKFWNIGLTDEGVKERDAATVDANADLRDALAENDKLRELVRGLYWCNDKYWNKGACDVCPIRGKSMARCERVMRKLGIEVSE